MIAAGAFEIVKELIYFPFLLSIWLHGPLTQENTKCPEYPPGLEDEDIRKIVRIYYGFEDIRIKRKLISDLGLANNPAAFDALLKMLSKTDKKDLQIEILRSLYNLRDEKALENTEILESFVNDEDPHISAYAQILLFRTEQNLEEITLFIKKCDSEYLKNILWEEIWNLVNEKGFKGEDELQISKNIILEMLDSKSEIDRANAAGLALEMDYSELSSFREKLLALAKGNSPREKIFISKVIKNNNLNDSYLFPLLAEDRLSAVRSLIALTKPENSKNTDLYLKLADDNSPDVRKSACSSLGNLKGRRILEKLLEHFSERKSDIRKSAVKAFTKVAKDADVAEIITGALKLPKSRNAAITVLGNLNMQEFSDKLINFLKTEKKPDVVVRIIKSLGKLKCRQAVPEIIEKSNSENPEIRLAVAEALGRIGGKSVRKTLLKLAEDSNVKVKFESFKAMGVTKDPFYMKRVQKNLYKINAEFPANIRTASVWTITQIGNPEKQILRQMEKIASEKILSYKGQHMFAVDYERASVLWAFVQMIKNDNKSVLENYNHCRKLINSERTGDNPAAGSDRLKDFIEQADMYLHDKEVKAGPMPYRKPEITVDIEK